MLANQRTHHIDHGSRREHLPKQGNIVFGAGGDLQGHEAALGSGWTEARVYRADERRFRLDRSTDTPRKEGDCINANGLTRQAGLLCRLQLLPTFSNVITMPLAIVHSRGLDGLSAPEVAVEVHLAGGLPSVTLVGLPDTEVKEARDRVRAALQNSGFDFPSKRITVNLAPP